jgi:hypothetical protein
LLLIASMLDQPSPSGDPMEDPVIRIVVLALVLTVAICGLGLCVLYWGDEVARPAWSERSVPPARLY